LNSFAEDYFDPQFSNGFCDVIDAAEAVTAVAVYRESHPIVRL
jgi:hypothetical protein